MNRVEHLLVCLGEEAAEIVKDASKALRFGIDDVNVSNPTGPSNRQRLIDELNDLEAVVQMLVVEGVLPSFWFDGVKQSRKANKVRNFMDYARDKGALTDGVGKKISAIRSSRRRK